jgi:hypothetical protein
MSDPISQNSPRAQRNPSFQNGELPAYIKPTPYVPVRNTDTISQAPESRAEKASWGSCVYSCLTTVCQVVFKIGSVLCQCVAIPFRCILSLFYKQQPPPVVELSAEEESLSSESTKEEDGEVSESESGDGNGKSVENPNQINEPTEKSIPELSDEESDSLPSEKTSRTSTYGSTLLKPVGSAFCGLFVLLKDLIVSFLPVQEIKVKEALSKKYGVDLSNGVLEELQIQFMLTQMGIINFDPSQGTPRGEKAVIRETKEPTPTTYKHKTEKSVVRTKHSKTTKTNHKKTPSKPATPEGIVQLVIDKPQAFLDGLIKQAFQNPEDFALGLVNLLKVFLENAQTKQQQAELKAKLKGSVAPILGALLALPDDVEKTPKAVGGYFYYKVLWTYEIAQMGVLAYLDYELLATGTIEQQAVIIGQIGDLLSYISTSSLAPALVKISRQLNKVIALLKDQEKVMALIESFKTYEQDFIQLTNLVNEKDFQKFSNGIPKVTESGVASI